ncbi:uncharacterized protein LOC119779852 isoform X2 [Cyprinodon tularosa]|uniref:uncharacterized protein LOC119779852 isoform X2 n=1 Tax=Cyprinodon tularosa TaxID=77115 RepID=UPI0018E25761|nr:uncharacterized protein LOC119779852 isoform X2 [Cyprinodon tularosa]
MRRSGSDIHCSEAVKGTLKDKVTRCEDCSYSGRREKTKMEDRDHLHPNILEAALKPEVLHLKDVKQMLVVKEEDPVDHLVGAELLNPQPPHTKEEQEEVCISLR